MSTLKNETCLLRMTQTHKQPTNANAPNKAPMKAPTNAPTKAPAKAPTKALTQN